jgi:hypothetical protein
MAAHRGSQDQRADYHQTSPPPEPERADVIFRSTRSTEVPKVTEGWLRGFWHLRHLLILGFSEISTTPPTQEVWLFPG